MVDRIPSYGYRIGPGRSNPVRKGSQGAAPTPAGGRFSELLQKEMAGGVSGEVKFSAHALSRLETRNITLSPQQLSRMTEAVDKAAAKGGRESLVLMDDMAFVVSVKNRTVITVVDGERMKENVFTNIDSAVITK